MQNNLQETTQPDASAQRLQNAIKTYQEMAGMDEREWALSQKSVYFEVANVKVKRNQNDEEEEPAQEAFEEASAPQRVFLRAKRKTIPAPEPVACSTTESMQE